MNINFMTTSHFQISTDGVVDDAYKLKNANLKILNSKRDQATPHLEDF